MKNINNPLFWQAHPISFANLYMKHDFFTLSNHDFVVKYLRELLSTQNEVKRSAIVLIVTDVWDGMSAGAQVCVVNEFKASSHWLASFDMFLDLYDLLKWDELEFMIKYTYHFYTGMVWDRVRF